MLGLIGSVSVSIKRLFLYSGASPREEGSFAHACVLPVPAFCVARAPPPPIVYA